MADALNVDKPASAEGKEPPPAPTEVPALPAIVADAADLKVIRSAVVDASGVSAGLWLSYLFVLFYLLVAAGGVRHRDLFFANPIRLPFLGVELPLEGFFWLGPALFLVVHAYVLLHFVLLSSKVGVFDAQLREQIADSEVRAQLRRQLPINIFVQFLAGPREARRGLVGALLRLIAWISLVVGPVAMLVFFELQFLPYHDLWITMWQRIAVVIDLLMLWMLWPSIVHGETAQSGWRRFGWGTGSIMACISGVSVLLVFAVATTSDEWLEKKLSWFPLRAMLVAGEVDEIAQKPKSLWSYRLVLPQLDVTDRAKSDTDDKLAAAPKMASLRGRDLQGAVLVGANLRKMDFNGANLQGADLRGANLQGADLTDANLQGANLNYSANLRGARLFEANLQGADLSIAVYLEGADFSFANLQGANLSYGANLQGADLTYANLEGADLSHGANLQGADLSHANLEGADLSYGEKSRTEVNDLANLQGASLKGANLRGADLRGAKLQGAVLADVFIWRTNDEDADPADALVRGIITGPRRECRQDETAGHDGLCEWSKADFEQLKREINSTIPSGTMRDQAQQRIDPILDPDLARDSDQAVEESWRRREKTAPLTARFEQVRAEVLKDAGCAADGAPFVVAALAERLDDEQHLDKGQLAAAFLRKAEDCPGAQGISAETRAKLMTLAKQASPAAAHPNFSRPKTPQGKR